MRREGLESCACACALGIHSTRARRGGRETGVCRYNVHTKNIEAPRAASRVAFHILFTPSNIYAYRFRRDVRIGKLARVVSALLLLGGGVAEPLALKRSTGPSR